MPQYCYSNPKTGEVIEVIQTMKEAHEYTDKEGVKWNRIFSVPQAKVNGKFDAWSAKSFVDGTGSRRGTVGDIFDKAKELSAERASKNGGVDPIVEKAKRDYSKARGGKSYVSPQEEANKVYKI